MQTAGIIGGSGFMGSWITKIFLENNFKVRVSSTDINNKSKYAHLLHLKNADNLEIFSLNLMKPGSIKSFAAGCDIIVHSGTPFILDVKDPQTELFEPTIKGTKNFLEVISHTPGIKKVLFIASVAAWNTSFPLNPATYSPDHIFSENDSPYISGNDHPYAQAKYYADQAVREFIAEQKDLPFEVVSVSLVFVTGNSLSAREDSTSMGLQYLFKNKIAPNPFVEMLFANDVAFSMVDVRNVAESIFNAATSKGHHGKNYLLAGESYKISNINRMLNKQAPISAPLFTYDNALARKDLNVEFTAAKETLFNCN